MPAPEFDQLELELGVPGPAPAPAEQLTPVERAILDSVGRASTKMGAIQEARSRLRTAGKPTTFKALHQAWNGLVKRKRLDPIDGGWRCA